MKTHKLAIEHLSKNDPLMARLAGRIKLKPAKKRKNHFRSLVTAIISQQLSTKVADVIIGRFLNLYGGKFPSPPAILKTNNKKLRAIGLSYQKISYIKNLAKAIETRNLEINKLKKLSDEEVIAELVKIKGIGRWTAEMFLIFSLGHLDIYSYGDLGLKNAVKRLYKIDPKYHTKKLAKLLDTWKPYRSVASRLLWKSLELKD